MEVLCDEKCTGCMACMNICPQNAISVEFSNIGFPVPRIDSSKCICCNLCTTICPVYSEVDTFKCYKAYIFQNENEDIRKESSSGGAFSAIASLILENGGVIAGAAFDEVWDVNHIIIDKEEDLIKLRGSKYVQSDTSKIYSEVEKGLSENKIVGFSGTPCQIAGLRKYLRKDYSNLLTIELACRGVGAPVLWKDYIKLIKSYVLGDIKNIRFRDKIFGYAGSTMLVQTSERNYCIGKAIQSFKMLFFSGYNVRPSCFSCKFKGHQRIGDLTLFDCWHVNEYHKEFDDDKGTSAILVNNMRGEQVVAKLGRKGKVVVVDKDVLISKDGDMIDENACIPSEIKNYWNDVINGKTILQLVDKYSSYGIKKSITEIIKPFLHRLNILHIVKRILQ